MSFVLAAQMHGLIQTRSPPFGLEGGTWDGYTAKIF